MIGTEAIGNPTPVQEWCLMSGCWYGDEDRS